MSARGLPLHSPAGSAGPRFTMRREQLTSLAPLGALAVLFLVGWLVVDGFVSRNNIESSLVLSSFLGISAAGQSLVVVLGGIDLSVAATIGFGEVATTVLYSRGFSVWEVLLLLAGCAIVIGAVNGGVASVFRVPPLIVSLGGGFMITGAVLMWTSGGATQGTAPQVFVTMTSLGSTTGPIPVPPIVLVWVAAGAVVLVIQRFTTLGRNIYALGSNPEAARLALVPRNRVWIAVYALSAASGLLTGVLLSGFAGGADFSVGQPYLFNSIAAVVVGGTSLLGGSGGYGRTIVGALVVTEIGTILVGVGFDAALQEAMLGVFIVIVALTGREPHLRTRV